MRSRRVIGTVLGLGVISTVVMVVAYRQIYGVGEDGDLVRASIARQLSRYEGTDFLVETEGSCPVEDTGMMRLDPLVVDQPGRGDGMTITDRLRQSIRGPHGISIHEISKHVVVIRWPGVGNDLFRTKIREVRLGEIEQYNPMDAIGAIEVTKEFTEAMERLGKKSYFSLSMRFINPPMPSLPHLPASMSDVTVESALVEILGKFHGVIVYSECSPWFRQGRYNFDYYGPGAGEPAT